MRAAVGISTSILGWGGTIVAAAAMWGIALGPGTTASLDAAVNVTSMPEATTGIGYVRDFAEWSPLAVLLILMVALLAAAVFNSRNEP